MSDGIEELRPAPGRTAESCQPGFERPEDEHGECPTGGCPACTERAPRRSWLRRLLALSGRTAR